MKIKKFLPLLIFTIATSQIPFNLQKAFGIASKSIVVVHTINKRGEEVALGSGVVIGKNEIVTNAHVVMDGTGAYLSKENSKWEVKEITIDPTIDLALLKTNELNLPPVKLANIQKIRPGQKLFAIGNPQGLELSLSEGIVSATRMYEGKEFIQTTTPISPGSSGGGIFNTNCELVGITTFMLKNSQNLNFAIPVNYITDLISQGMNLQSYKSQQFKITNDNNFISLNKIQNMSNEELLKLAKSGNPIAEEQLGFRLESGSDRINMEWVNNLNKDIYRGTYWLDRAAMHGSNIAASDLINGYLNNINTNLNLADAKRLARQMITNLDNNYDIYTNSEFKRSSIEGKLELAAMNMFNVYVRVVAEELTQENLMEALVWSDIMAKLMEKDLAQNINSNSNQIAKFLETRKKQWIDNRNMLYHNVEKSNGVEFVEEGRKRARALMNAYGITDN